MAVTQNNYTGNGSTVLYSFTFPYLDPSDIKIEVNGTLTTAYTLANATTIQFNTAPANGATIRIYRDTDIEQLSSTFFPGSAIRADDLNDDFTQTLYKAQELESLVEPLASLQGTYYGAYASNPTVDPFGNPPTPGDLYFNTTLDQMYVFNGSTWQQASADATVARFKYIAAGGETSLSGADANSNILAYTVGLEMVYLNGAFLTRGVDYTATNGSSITGLVALTTGDVAEIIVFSQINALDSIPGANIVDGTITSAKIADGTIVNADVNASAGIVASKLSFTQAGAGAVARTVDSKLKDVVSVKDFGAVGDGVADDTNAFQLAGNEANGGLAYVPPGNYNITSAVTSSSQFFLEPAAVIPNQYRITAKLVDAADRDYEAMMGMGYFNIWLTGNSFSNPASGSFIATLWRLFYDGTAGTFTVDQAGGPFSIGATNGLRWNQTVAGSGGTYRTIEYRVEDGTTFNNGKATLSFFLTAGTGSFPVTAEVVQFFGSGGSPSADVVCGSQAFTATTTTTRFSLTVDMPSTGSKTFGNNIDDCVKIRFYLPTNATFNCVFNEVKFERGPIMTPFSQIPLSIQQPFIDRYLQYTIVSIGFNATAAGQYMYAGIPYKTEMRRVPDRTWSGGSSANLNPSLGGGRPATTSVEKYGATAFIFSAAAGACYSINQLLQLDARL